MSGPAQKQAPDSLAEVWQELIRQDVKWGEQNHPDGTGGDKAWREAQHARAACDDAHARGEDTWRLILAEEVAEAFAEGDVRKLRAELLQVAAVAVQWVEAIDRRTAGAS